jgi:tetratricopeptide (TPR) repeat protein
MTNLFKRRGSVASLIGNHPREEQLIVGIEAQVDAGLERRSLIDAMIAQLQALAAASPADASWRFYLGRLMMAAGDPLEARDELEAAAVLDPRDPRIAAHLAIWYEAALLASCGERSNIDLPPLAGPNLCADASRFAGLDSDLPPATLAARVTEWAHAALRFRLSREDQRFLEYHLTMARTHPFATVAPDPELSLLSRTA